MADVAENTTYLCQLCSGRPGFWLDQTTNTPIALEDEHLYCLARCDRCNGNVAEARKQLELERQGFFAGPAVGFSITEHLTFEPKLGRSLCGKKLIPDLIDPPTQHHHLTPNLCSRCRSSVYALSEMAEAKGITLYEVWKKARRPSRSRS